MKKMMIMSAVLAMVAAPAFGSILDPLNDGVTNSVLGHVNSMYPIGGTHNSLLVTPGAIYSNIDNPTGYYGTFGGAANNATGTVRVTKLYMDDTQIPGNAPNITSFSFSFCNGNAANINTAQFGMAVRFFNQASAGAAPGTFLGGVNVTLGSGSLLAGYCYGIGPVDISATPITLPAALGDGKQHIFSGQAAYSTSTLFTNAVMNNLGQEIMGAPGIGTSDDGTVSGAGIWRTTAIGGTATNPPATFTSNNPVGSFGAYSGISSNYDWELFPEPASLTLLGLGAMMLIRRRR